jgi:hypothetical protein
MPVQGQRRKSVIAATHSQTGTVRGRMVSTTILKLYPREKLGALCAGG